MNELKFTGKTWRIGRSVVVTIPSDFVQNGMVPIGEELQFSVKVNQ